MKIKNKFSKQRIDKDNLLLNKIMNIKKSIRNKTSKIIPLTDMEKFLYINNCIIYIYILTIEISSFIFEFNFIPSIFSFF